MKPTDIDLAWKAHAEKMAELNALIDARETIQAQIERASLEVEALAAAAGDALPFAFDSVYCQEKR
ncbi:MAG: hypothetical protein KDD10_18990 [Phaeodactylibacter sp.]|nr:hypothetical protein [Phaeodactylibacter sp.]